MRALEHHLKIEDHKLDHMFKDATYDVRVIKQLIEAITGKIQSL
jgi:hypothetical protein